MIVAVEDVIGEAVVRKLVTRFRPDLEITTVLGHRGRGYIQNRARELNRSAERLQVMILTDLNSSGVCPPELVRLWFGSSTPRVLFRVAVMEVESWLLADRLRVASMLGVTSSRLPGTTDDILDPKEHLVNLARGSRLARIRRDLVPLPASTSVVGAAYNPTLVAFVANLWDPVEAAMISPSLARTIDRLRAW